MYIAELLFCRSELITLSTTVYTSIQELGYISIALIGMMLGRR
jgi:hypothetical protein